MSKKLYVLDTSVFLTDYNALYAYDNNDIVIPMKVLEEIDKHKKRQDGVGTNARKVIHTLDELREKGFLGEGIKISKGHGLIKVDLFDKSCVPDDLDLSVPDNQIIAVALKLKNKEPDRKVIVVSKDINMRVKCDALGILSEDYQPNQIVQNVSDIYTGFTTYLVDDQTVDRFYAKEKVFATKEQVKLFPNQLVMLVSSANEKKTALCKFKNYNLPLIKIQEHDDVFGIKAKNKEQQFALDLLLDNDIKLVTLLGIAGSGKSLLAISAALELLLNQKNSGYKKLIVSRPVQPTGKDLGFLPGSKEEKMEPWLAPIKDNLEFLLGDRRTVETYFEKGIIEVEALTYIRGRSISNAVIVFDEFQSTTRLEVKTAITRVGENTKIIMTGDHQQIDNPLVDATTNGLTYAVEKFKDQEIAGHITMQRGERSNLATIASEVL